MDNKEYISREDLFEYTFYDDSHKVVACLNEENIKKFLDADILIFDEKEHK